MAIRCQLADGSEVTLEEAPAGHPGEAETLLIVLALPAPGKLRKGHALPAGASLLAVVEKAAGLKAGVLGPLRKLSTGITTHEDYLNQFSEDWEREEYGRHAEEVVSRNQAATQPAAPFLEAVTLARTALADGAVRKAVLDDHPTCLDVIERLHQRVEQAVHRGATTVTVEIDELD